MTLTTPQVDCRNVRELGSIVFAEFDSTTLGDIDEVQFAESAMLEANFILLNAKISTRVQCYSVTYGPYSGTRTRQAQVMYIHMLADRYSDLNAAVSAAELLESYVMGGRFVVPIPRVLAAAAAAAWDWSKSDIAAYRTLASSAPSTPAATSSTAPLVAAGSSGSSKDDDDSTIALIVGISIAAIALLVMFGAVLAMTRSENKAAEQKQHEAIYAVSPPGALVGGSPTHLSPTYGSMPGSPGAGSWQTASNYGLASARPGSGSALDLALAPNAGDYAPGGILSTNYAFANDPLPSPAAYQPFDMRGPNPLGGAGELGVSQSTVDLADAINGQMSSTGGTSGGPKMPDGSSHALLDILLAESGPDGRPALDHSPSPPRPTSLYSVGGTANPAFDPLSDPLSNREQYLDITGDNAPSAQPQPTPGSHYYPSGDISLYTGFDDVTSVLSQQSSFRAGRAENL